MADHIDEEYLDNPTNTQSENSPDEIIPTKGKETIKPKEESENMEVHHHPNLHHKPKKWKEYFLDFLMIFLAVTMGFLAESYREHYMELKRVSQFANLLVADLKSDTSWFNNENKRWLTHNQILIHYQFIKWADIFIERHRIKTTAHYQLHFLFV